MHVHYGEKTMCSGAHVEQKLCFIQKKDFVITLCHHDVGKSSLVPRL